MTLQHNLQTLEVSGLVYPIATYPDFEYLFRHVLVQEATYHTLLRQDRKQLHHFVGQALERLYPERQTELAPMLAMHFAEAGDTARALAYYALAGDDAAGRYANAEAAMHFGRAIEMLTDDRGRMTADGGATAETPNSQIPSPKPQSTSNVQPSTLNLQPSTMHAAPSLVELFNKRGRALELSGQYHEALVTYQSMLSLAQVRGDEALELEALVLLAQSRSTPNANFNPAQGVALAEQALAIARRLGDPRAEVRILWSLVNLGINSGRIAETIENAEVAIRIARERGLREELAYVLNDVVRAYLSDAQWERGVAALTEAASLWRELHNYPMLTDSLSTLALFYLFGGLYDDGIRTADEALQLSRTIHSKWGEAYSQYGVGRAYWDRGDPGRAIAVMEDSIRLSFEAGFLSPQLYTRCDLAQVYGSLGAVQRGIDLAHQALHLTQTDMSPFQALPLAVLSMLHLQRGDQIEAGAVLRQAQADFDAQNVIAKPAAYQAIIRYAISRQDYEQALKTATEYEQYVQKFHTNFLLADCLYLKGRALLESGRVALAHLEFLEARRIASDMGARRVEWQILAALSDIAARQGDVEQSADLRRQARDIVDFITAHTPGPLAVSFLAMPEVRSMLIA